MREAAIRENMNKLKELQNQYPGKIKILQSESDVSSINMDAVMAGGTAGMKQFDNADPKMRVFLAEQLAAGNKVLIMAGGKTKLLITTGRNIF